VSATEETIRLLRSIDSSLKQLVKQQGPTASGVVATDRDLDGKYGNPAVKFNPRDWTGASCKGRPFSACPPEFLDLLAETFDYFARVADEKQEMTDNGKPVGDYKRQDAARARGWAVRIRSGRHLQTHEPADAQADAQEFASDEAGTPGAADIRW
jgi:hypothetical protein